MPTRNHKHEGVGDAREEVGRFDSSSFTPQGAGSATGVTDFFEEKAEKATGALGAGMESLGETIREHAPQQGMLGAAGEAVAGKLETGGRYLEEHGLKGIGQDLTNMIRRNPVPALLVGIGVGYLVARMMRSRS